MCTENHNTMCSAEAPVEQNAPHSFLFILKTGFKCFAISIPVTFLENCWATRVAVVLFTCHVIFCMCYTEGNDQFLDNSQWVLFCFVTHSNSSNYKVWTRFELRIWRKKRTENYKISQSWLIQTALSSFWKMITNCNGGNQKSTAGTCH